MGLQINKYKDFFADIKQRIKDAQYSAMKAVNIEQIIPTLKVVAKPFIGPEPIKDRITAVIKVVTLASNIVRKARL